MKDFTMTAPVMAIKETQPSGVDFDAIRRSLRRHLFVINRPDFNVNSAALRTDFAMHLEYLAAATFKRDKAIFDTGKYASSTDLLLIKPLEQLQVTVTVFASKAGAAPDTYQTRIVHSANPLGEEAYPENREFQTTNVYQVSGVLTVQALELFWSEHDGLEKYARANLPEADERSPFCHWQYSRLQG
jgi:hypothetical protein